VSMGRVKSYAPGHAPVKEYSRRSYVKANQHRGVIKGDEGDRSPKKIFYFTANILYLVG